MTTRNLELKRATWRRYYYNTFTKRATDHPTKIKKREYYGAWRKARPDLVNGYAKSYRDRHKLLVLVRNAVRRSEINCVECDAGYLKTAFVGRRPHACACCGVLFEYSSKSKRNQPARKAPTLDRINHRLGYVRGNVAVICWRCNVLKKDGTLEEIEMIAKYMRSYVDR